MGVHGRSEMGGGYIMRRVWSLRLVTLILLAAPAAAVLAAVPRAGIPAGEVVSAGGDETIQFIAESNWRNVEIEQDLLAGDKLRTGPNGALALRFVDQTLIRVHRNSELVVRQIGGTQAQLDLSLGQIWARAVEGGEGVEVTTPSATAAIKGTDWSMSVEASGRTTLVVISGIVNLSNQFGAIDVAAGEAAIAEIGRAPNKILLARPPGREQMLYYLQATDLFAALPVNDLSGPDGSQRRKALLGQDPQTLSAEERVELAELALRYDGEGVSADLLRPLGPRDGYPPEIASRMALLEAFSAAAHSDWAGAMAAFQAADAGLSGRRRLSAKIGRYLVLILSGRAAEARAMEPEIAALPADSYQILAKAWFAAVAGDLLGASKLVADAEPLYPAEPMLPVLRTQLAILLGDEAQAREAIAKAAAIDPGNSNVLFTEAAILSDYDKDLRAARAKLEQAIAIAPGNTDAWNNLGLVLDELEDFPGAERAHKTSIALDPYASHAHSNYARFLLIHNKLAEAKAENDIARQLDPGNFAALQVEGVWLLAQGRLEEAIETLLGSIAANPQVSSSSVVLAIAYYQSGQVGQAMQSLEDGDRLDPNDPEFALIRTVIALNESQAGEAIRSAREAYRRYLRQGRRVSSPLAAARGAGSYLFSAFSNLSLEQWGRAYGDLSFDPFDSSSQFYQASAPVTVPVENGQDQDGGNFNSILQGLAIDPLSIAGRSRYADLIRQPFFDPVLGAGGNLRHDDSDGWFTNASANAFTNQGLPVSLFASLDYESNGQVATNVINEDFTGAVFLGTEFDANNRLFVFGQADSFEDSLPRAQPVDPELAGAQDSEANTYLTGVGYSHRFGADNVLLALAGATGIDQDIKVDFGDFGLGAVVFDAEVQQQGGYASLAHYLGLGDVTLRYGIEGQVDEGFIQQEASIGGASLFETRDDDDRSSARLFTDAIVHFDPRLAFEFGLNLSRFDDDTGNDVARLDPRVGASWLFAEDQWLRAAYRHDTTLPIAGSLAPVATLGLTPAATTTENGGLIKTTSVRWDAEWTERFFTALEYQHQEIDDYSVNWQDLAVFLAIPDVPEGDLDILTLSMNAWVLEEVGLFAEGSWIDSDNESGGGDLPLIPDWRARFGLTWVSPIDLRFSLTETLIGSREGDLDGNDLSSFATTDVAVAWQPFDRHILLSAGISNLFDEDYHIVHDVPAPGRVFTINGEIRF